MLSVTQSIDLLHYNSGPGYNGVTLATINADFLNHLSVTQAQAAAILMESLQVRYNSSLSDVIASVTGDASAQSFAGGNSGLHALLMSDLYNGVFTMRGNLAKAVANNDPAALIADQLFNNVNSGGQYVDGLENRRIVDLNAAFGAAPSETEITPTNAAQAEAVLDAVFGHANDIADYIAAAGRLGGGAPGVARLTALEGSLTSNSNQVLANLGTAYVEPGDTLDTIASRSSVTGVTAADVAALNGISVGAELAGGSLLQLPTAIFTGLPPAASASYQYAYDVVTKLTVATPNAEGFGSLTVFNSDTGATIGIVDLLTTQTITSNPKCLSRNMLSWRNQL